MKKLILFLTLLASHAYAQVNLDQPIPAGPNDQVFKSTVDANAAYLIPTTLMVLNAPRISEINGEIHANFDVGMNQATYQQIAAKIAAPLQLRMMRGWEAKMDPKGSMDTPAKFASRLIPLGDAGVLGANLAYTFTAKKIGPAYGKETTTLFQDLFGSKTARHLGTILYEFNAVRGGQPYQAKSAVGIFATNVLPPPPSPAPGTSPKDFVATQFSAMVLLDSAPVVQPQILMDAQQSCWDNLQIGQICLR